MMIRRFRAFGQPVPRRVKPVRMFPVVLKCPSTRSSRVPSPASIDATHACQRSDETSQSRRNSDIIKDTALDPCRSGVGLAVSSVEHNVYGTSRSFDHSHTDNITDNVVIRKNICLSTSQETLFDDNPGVHKKYESINKIESAYNRPSNRSNYSNKTNYNTDERRLKNVYATILHIYIYIIIKISL